MNAITRLFALSLSTLLLLFASGTARAKAAAEPTDKTLSPYFFVEDGDPSVDRLPLKDTSVDVAITGVIADVTVRQTYENKGARPIHARYVFPASTRAAVYGMTMTVGDRKITAKIEERKKAQQDFEKAKQEGKSASLLEESRPNVFSMSVANVMPNDTIAVELKYTELLVPTAGAYEFVYPTVVGPRYSSKVESEAKETDRFVKSPYLHDGTAPTSQLHLAAKLSTGVPIQDLGSPSHTIAPHWSAPSRAELALGAEEQFSGNRDFILRYRLAGREVSSGLLLYQGKDENFFLLMAHPPERTLPEQVLPREYIFLLDVSGSMNGFPLDTAKVLMRDLFRAVRPADTFNVVLFADGSKTLARESLPATPSNLARAAAFIGPQPGGGGTELLAAVKQALAIPKKPDVSRTVVLVTDGYIEAEKEVFEYVRDHLDKANLFSFGIGSSVNRYLMEGIARAGQGEPFIVTEPKEAAQAAAKFREYIQAPVLTGIQVGFSGFDAYDVEPSKIPDLFASRPIVVFGKWRGQAQGTVEIHGKSGKDPYHALFNVAPALAQEDHRALRYLWARTRIANLSDFGPGDNDEDRAAAVTSLGLGYGLLTRYTSFIAVQEVVRNAGGIGHDVDQPLPMPVGVSDLAVGDGVTGGAEPELVWVFAALLLLLVAHRLARSGKLTRASEA
jgi:Ca-activated chloride channel family protein